MANKKTNKRTGKKDTVPVGITAREIAELCGMTPQAISVWLKNKVAAGYIKIIGKSAGKNLYNADNKFIKQYIDEHTYSVSPAAETETAESLAEVNYRYLKLRAEKLEIANQKAMGELMPRSFAARYAGKQAAIFQNNLLSVCTSTAATIAAEVKADDKTRIRIEEILTKDIYAVLAAYKRECNDYLLSLKSEPIQ